MYNFPNPSDIDSKFVNNLSKERIDELINHLQLRFENILTPNSTKEKLETLHVESLIRIARARKLTIDILDEVGRP